MAPSSSEVTSTVCGHGRLEVAGADGGLAGLMSNKKLSKMGNVLLLLSTPLMAWSWRSKAVLDTMNCMRLI